MIKIMREMRLRKKPVVKLPQASSVEKLPSGKRRGCISRVVMVTPVGKRIPRACTIELKSLGLIVRKMTNPISPSPARVSKW